MENKKWKPVLEIIDPICKRLDFGYRVSYKSEDGNRIGFKFWRAYDSAIKVAIALDSTDSTPDLLLDWFSYPDEVRIKCAAGLGTELADAIVDAFSQIRNVKTMQGEAVENPKRLSPDTLGLFQRDVNPLITLSDLKEMLIKIEWEIERRKTASEVLSTPTARAATGAAQVTDATPKEGAGQRCIFQNKGTFWEITYSAKPFILQETRGLADIITLLKNPGRDIPASELCQLGNDDSATLARASDQELFEEGLTESEIDADGEPILDDEAKRRYRERIEELQEQKKTATGCGKYDEAQKAEEEIEDITRELTSKTGLGGKSRKFRGQSDKARLAVLDRIKSALSKVREQDDALAKYLETTIETGAHCVYRPEKADPIQLIIG